MSLRVGGVLAAAAVVLASAGTASACHACKRNPCVMAAPAPAYAPPAVQCVTEMVPYTVMRPRTRIDYREEVCTVIERIPETTWEERQRVVCKPVFDTSYVTRQVTVCKPVYQTDYVTQNVTVCRPETVVQQVTEMCMQPVTQMVSVPAPRKCGHAAPACGCQTVAQTCYTPVPVVRNVSVTRMVPETQTRQVPVTRCTIVPEQKVEQVPVVHCRMVQEVVTDRVPHVTIRCVPRQVTRRIPVPVCEVVPVTCYRPVTRMVPVTYAAAPQAGPAPSGQGGGPSGQSAPSSQL